MRQSQLKSLDLIWKAAENVTWLKQTDTLVFGLQMPHEQHLSNVLLYTLPKKKFSVIPS